MTLYINRSRNWDKKKKKKKPSGARSLFSLRLNIHHLSWRVCQPLFSLFHLPTLWLHDQYTVGPLNWSAWWLLSASPSGDPVRLHGRGILSNWRRRWINYLFPVHKEKVWAGQRVKARWSRENNNLDRIEDNVPPKDEQVSATVAHFLKTLKLNLEIWYKPLGRGPIFGPFGFDPGLWRKNN